MSQSQPAGSRPQLGTLTIRQLDPQEMSAVMRIEVESFPPGDAYTHEVMERHLRDSSGGFFVAEVNGSVVGYGVGVTNGSTAHINSMAVLPSYRNHGIGRRMLEHMISHFVEQGATEVSLEVNEDNAQAIHLYESFGFIRTGSMSNYYESGAAAITMSRSV